METQLPASDARPATELERIAARHYKLYKNKDVAIWFARTIDRIYPQVKGIYPNRETTASFMLKLWAVNPDYELSAKTLKLLAGYKFSTSLRPSL